MFPTVRDGPHRSCPKAHRVPVHPKGFLHSYLPLSRHRASLSQAPRLGYLPSPHVAFQEHAAHMARWPTMLNSKGSWSTCILQGLTTFLPCAFTAHRQPAIEGPIAHAFEGMQQSQGDHLTGPEVGLGMFGYSAQLLIDLIEQRRDKIHCDHGLLRSSQGCTLSTSLEEVHAHDKKASKYYCNNST